MKIPKSTIAMLKYLLKGNTLDIGKGFTLFGYSCLPREIPRKIEKPIGIVLKRDKVVGKSRWGEHFYFFKYSLKKEDYTKIRKLCQQNLK